MCIVFPGPLLECVPRVPGNRKILSSCVMAPVNFYEIPREQLPGTRKILTPLISGTLGLIFLIRALTFKNKIQCGLLALKTEKNRELTCVANLGFQQ